MPKSPYEDMPVELEVRLIRAVGNEQEHAQVRREIREAGFPELADELDRIAAQHGDGRSDPTAGLTPTQQRLYDQVVNDWSGRDLKKVLDGIDAPDVDKQAVAQALYAG